jgi:hypothetical protein
MRATAPDGKDWIFPTACLPAGWKDSTQTGTRFDDCAQPIGIGGGGSGGGGGTGGM